MDIFYPFILQEAQGKGAALSRCAEVGALLAIDHFCLPPTLPRADPLSRNEMEEKPCGRSRSPYSVWMVSSCPHCPVCVLHLLVVVISGWGSSFPVAESCSQYVPVPLEGLQMWLFHSWGIICTLNTPKADELIIIFYLSHL